MNHTDDLWTDFVGQSLTAFRKRTCGPQTSCDILLLSLLERLVTQLFSLRTRCQPWLRSFRWLSNATHGPPLLHADAGFYQLSRDRSEYVVICYLFQIWQFSNIRFWVPFLIIWKKSSDDSLGLARVLIDWNEEKDWMHSDHEQS